MTYYGAPVHRWSAAIDRSLAGAAVAAPREAGPASPCNLTLVTWNVWFAAYAQQDRACRLLAEALAQDPDVVCLQEVTDAFHEAMLRARGLRRRLVPTEEYLPSLDGYDVALWVRPGVEVLRCWTVGLPTGMQRRCLVADLRLPCAAPGGPVPCTRVACVHLESNQPGESSADLRAQQLRTILPHLRSEPLPGGGLPEATALLGDFNIDVADAAENAALAGDGAVADLWEALRRGEPGHTEDTEANLMLAQRQEGRRKQVRYDRVVLVSPCPVGTAPAAEAGGQTQAPQAAPVEERARAWLPDRIELLGTERISAGVWPSDHFGLVARLRRAH